MKAKRSYYRLWKMKLKNQISIQYALAEGFIQLFFSDGRITLVNLRLLPIQLVRRGGEFWLTNGRQSLNLKNAKSFIVAV